MESPGRANIERFNNRADNYDKYRPGYPPSLIQYLFEHVPLSDATVVEAGCGTGIFSELLVPLTKRFYALEPNAEMMNKAKRQLSLYHNCYLFPNRAESTGLPDNSSDLIVCAQSFHWFDPEHTKKEFKRILKDNGNVAVIWNIRSTVTTFGRAYEQFIREFSTDREQIEKREKRADRLPHFFREGSMRYWEFDYHTQVSFEQLEGNTFSYSYMPNTDHPGVTKMRQTLKQLFNEHQQKNTVELHYKTVLFLGKM